MGVPFGGVGKRNRQILEIGDDAYDHNRRPTSSRYIRYHDRGMDYTNRNFEARR